jgi:HAD superfamily hydrolase (TIGR01509 family)
MPAILFGSIGTLADTSELQRAAFNQAFAELDLPWHWDRDEYARLLSDSGGEQRIADYAAAEGVTVDASAVHHRKSEIFQKRLGDGDVTARDGVLETIEQCRRDEYRIALVTTTARENITALAAALSPEIDLGSFDLVIDRSEVARAKPDSDAYEFALQQLGERAEECLAIEDNVGGVASAVAAGLRCVAFPGTNNAAHDFEQADARVDELSLAQLRPLIDQR